MKIAAWTILVLLSVAVVHADRMDTTRGLLYRIDADAWTVRLHPSDSDGPAKALQRVANDAADQLRAEGLPVEAAALKREAANLAAAAQDNQTQNVRAHAIRVEQLIRQLDERLPPRGVVP